MRKFFKITFILLLPLSLVIAQSGEDQLVVIGKSLKGKVVDGEKLREVIGDVIITHGAVTITCDTAVQHLERNEIELKGNVVAKKDTVTLFTPHGYYFGESKTAYTEAGLVLNDGHYVITAEKGYYYYNENKAHFFGSVELFDTLNTLISDDLTYYNDNNKAVAVGHVLIADSASAITADSLIHYRNDNSTFAFNNVKIGSHESSVTILGNRLEDFGNENYTKITDSPVLIKTDTTETGKIDSLIISCVSMESVEDSLSKYLAIDSVRIVRDDFSSVNQHAVYYKEKNMIFTYREEDELQQPILWFENSQLIGDSIFIYINKKNNLDHITILHNASAISKNPLFDFRYDQISGDTLELFFENDELKKAFVYGGFLSIYYLYDDGETNGLIKSSAKNAVINFKNNLVKEVKMYKEAITEYYPENLVLNKEKDFTLPTFVIYKNRPTKETILKGR
ncbi:MAG: LPS export ABC transporter periplasmic protein LptC [Chlorobi bacterium]|nr:LPS export ABC transporter periplasmic protein LptC [Chlorobiota bacterium]